MIIMSFWIGPGMFDGFIGSGEYGLEGKMVRYAIHTFRAKIALLQGSKNACKREMKVRPCLFCLFVCLVTVAITFPLPLGRTRHFG